MPTTAKLVAALWFALLAWLAAEAFARSLAEAAAVGRLREGAALIGLCCGWRVMGADHGRGYLAGLGAGLKSSFLMAFCVLFVFSALQMMDEAFKMRFDGPVAALLGLVQDMGRNAAKLRDPGVIGILALGGMLGGLVVEWTGRRWR